MTLIESGDDSGMLITVESERQAYEFNVPPAHISDFFKDLIWAVQGSKVNKPHYQMNLRGERLYFTFIHDGGKTRFCFDVDDASGWWAAYSDRNKVMAPGLKSIGKL